MNKDFQLKFAVGLALVAVVFAIEYAYFTGHYHSRLPNYEAQSSEWETVRIRANLPEADFLYVLTTCPSCHPANDNVRRLEAANPQLNFLWVHPKLVNLPALMAVLGRSYGIDETRQREMTPVLYGPARAWVGVQEVKNASLEGALEGPRPHQRMGSSWEWLKQGRLAVMHRFEKYQWYVIALAGLIDGINPCAIATIIFLLSYLTLSGMQRSVLKVGLLFTLGCFVAYLLIGLGLWRLSNMAVSAYWGRRIIYPLIAFPTLTVALLAFAEFIELVRTGSSETILKLPRSWLLRVHEIVRRVVRAEHAVLLAAPVAIVVTLIEFGCTGQVYLPTITYVSSLPGQRLTALPILLAYNVAFIIPLLAVIIGYRITAGKLQRPKAPVPLKYVRLAEGVLLGAIGAFMLWATFHAWVT